RYGYTDSSATSLLDSYKKSRSKGLGKEAKRRIMIGTYVLSSGYYDAYYRQAQQVRTKLISEFADIFSKYDAIMSPTAPSTAFKIGEHTQDPLEMYLTDVMTVAANLTGIPAISLPSGFDAGLPIGLQLMAKQHADIDLLCLANTIEEMLV
ncbi:MAG: Asp-tRNA(Asn)/Glu-tRNA(Gln) amidotransferase subunit GatA, partial [Actinobacteria bacterium]|nr:Asp-tRNA(Asn)/Glu-tRNA(Gln) amidotransferase subunit GatA [Actinomycetota bacterium]